ncbi:hypothetical protein [Neptunicella sp.]|uniref:hypothetical protein n=1 Tax=Neptunicella sp. TaxID=2125986 RepID=UPI003F690661
MTVNQSLSQNLQQQLPTKLQNALYYSNNDGPIIQLIQHNINRDLTNLNIQNKIPVFNQCHARVTELMADPQKKSEFGQVSIEWALGKLQKQTFITFSCDTNWTVTTLYPSGFAALLLILAYLMPVPLSANGQNLKQKLLAHLSHKQAHYWARRLQQAHKTQQLLFIHLLSEHLGNLTALFNWTLQSPIATLTENQLDWFMLANKKFDYTKQQALTVALSPDKLNFTDTPGQVVLHGLPLKLMKTPYFYYLWYACLRCQGDGWQLNPPVNRTDRIGAEMLIELMRNAGGHSKAINDLVEQGLRAKILDQNRNKLKAELISLLGESLAENYLFDTERDLKSGRYRYRLKLNPDTISLPDKLINN